MKLIVEDYSIMHLLLKCFNKAKDLDRALQLYETVRTSSSLHWRFASSR